MGVVLPRIGATRVYGELHPAGDGFLAFLVWTLPESPVGDLPLEQAWDDPAYAGYVVLLPAAPASREAFANALQDSGTLPAPKHTGIAWLRYNDQSQALTLVQRLSTEAAAAPSTDVILDADASIRFRNYGFMLHRGSRVSLDAAGNSATLILQYPAVEGLPPPNADGIRVSLTDARRFAFTGQTVIGDYSDDPVAGWDIACRYYAKTPDGRVRAWRFPVFVNPPAGDWRLFDLRWDLFNPLDPSRTTIAFTHVAYRFTPGVPPDPSFITLLDTGTWAPSVFRSRYGRPIELRPMLAGETTDPARLVFQSRPNDRGEETLYTLTPAGDFLARLAPLTPSAQGDAPTQQEWLCGLAGTEFVQFDVDAIGAQTVLRFHPDRPAFAPMYPLYGAQAAATPPRAAGAPVERLTGIYKTSWVSLRTPGPHASPTYYSQPQRAPLFLASVDPKGAPGDVDLFPSFIPPYADLGEANVFPMVGYGATGTATPSGGDNPDTSDFEAQIIAPARFQIIADPAHRVAPTQGVGRAVDALTPQGLRAVIDGPAWKTVWLAQTVDPDGVVSSLAFHDLPTRLISAFQSSDLFLVISSATNIGRFDNRIVLDGWPFTITLGTGPEQSLKNILVLKYGKGTVKDRAADISSWTQADDFNVDAFQVSRWLRRYIDDAELQAPEEPGLQDFVRLVQDEHWNGILALRVDVDLQAFPDDLKGLLGGMDLTQFFGHHLGVLQNRPKPQDDPEDEQNSSLFGLIAYRDTNGDPGDLREASPPAMFAQEHVDLIRQSAALAAEDDSSSFNYRVITLVITFRNSLVDDFESRIILTILKLFGRPAELSETSATTVFRNSVVFDGSFQRINGRPSYSFTSSDSYRFDVTSDVLNRVEFSSAQFLTVRQEKQAPDGVRAAGTEIRARFQLDGDMSFVPLPTLDVFSFGPEAASLAGVTDVDVFGAPVVTRGATAGPPVDAASAGLRFTGFAITMAFYLERPTVLAFDVDSTAMTFDTGNSEPRPLSVFTKLPLKLSQLLVGRAAHKPPDLGYVTVNTPTLSRSKTLSTEWYGLVYTLNLGSLGALASNVGFSAQLMAAWSPADTSPVAVFLNLPGLGAGKKGISLQSVLRLNVGDLLLTTEVDADKQVKGYVLKLQDVALSLLGKKLPPSGVTDIALFGMQSESQGTSSLSWYAAYYTATSAAMHETNHGANPEANRGAVAGAAVVDERDLADGASRVDD